MLCLILIKMYWHSAAGSAPYNDQKHIKISVMLCPGLNLSVADAMKNYRSINVFVPFPV